MGSHGVIPISQCLHESNSYILKVFSGVIIFIRILPRTKTLDFDEGVVLTFYQKDVYYKDIS